MSYAKAWRSYEEQLQLLIDRGLLVTDRALARDYLERIGYYRLSGYWFALRRPGEGREVLDAFKPGATFQNAVDLYVFDKQLRLLVMDALERIEVALRVDVSHVLGRLDTFAYLRPELFHDKFSARSSFGASRHEVWLSKHEQLIARSSEEFVRHNKARYGLPLAIWVACELWDFGTLSMLFSGMREAEQDAIAGQYGVSNGRVFATWLRSLNYLRNVCAHHGRLWNRNIVDQPRLPPAAALPWVAPFEADAQARARCFLLLRITCHLLRVINPRSSWPDRMASHLRAFPALSRVGLSLAGMGVPHDWDKCWNEKPLSNDLPRQGH